MIEELRPYCVAEYDQKAQIDHLADHRRIHYWQPKITAASRLFEAVAASRNAARAEREALTARGTTVQDRINNGNGRAKDAIHAELFRHFLGKTNRQVALLQAQFDTLNADRMAVVAASQERYDFERGICFGLCCKWIETHTHDPKWQNDVRNARAEQRIRNLHVHGLKGEDDVVGADQLYSSVLGFFQALNTQRSYYIAEVDESRDAMGHFHQKSHPEIFNLGLRKHGFAIGETEIAQKTDPKTRDLLFTTNGSSKTLVGELTQRPGYRLIILRYPDPTSTSKRDMFHAICCYHTDGYMFGIGSHHCFFDPNLGEFWIPWGDVSKFYRLVYEDYASRSRKISGYVTFPVARVSAPQA